MKWQVGAGLRRRPGEPPPRLAVAPLMRRNDGQMVERGATTCWELYPSIGGEAINRAMVEFPTRRHCHAWSAGPVHLLGA